MLKNSSIRSTVRKLAISAGIYRPGTLTRYMDRSYSERLRQDMAFYSRLLKPDSLCFDVGANIGEKSEALLGIGMKVVAFEPQPVCARELRARCRHFGEKFALCESALGAKAGAALLHVCENPAVSSFHKDWNGAEATMEVPVTTLDHAIALHGRPMFCKIDVEGWELEVLKGLTQSVPLLSIEYVLRERDIQNTMEALDYLSQFGDLRVNVTPAETLSFALPEWVSLTQWRSIFPSSFMDREGYYYGDLFIRTEGTQTSAASSK